MSSYRDLIVWQKSMDLVEAVYSVTSNFPKTEQYSLVSQMQRCAVSIPSNIAEGYARRYKKEYLQFLRVAYGSGAELETQLPLAHRLKFLSETEHEGVELLLTEVMKMLNVLQRKLNPKP